MFSENSDLLNHIQFYLQLMVWIYKHQIHFVLLFWCFSCVITTETSTPLFLITNWIYLCRFLKYFDSFFISPVSKRRSKNNDMKWWLPAEAITSLASFANKPTVFHVIYQKRKKPRHHRWRGTFSSLHDVFSVWLMNTLPLLGWNVITLIEFINHGNVLLNEEFWDK